MAVYGARIQVAVRVRPFNQRETELNTDLVVKMSGSQAILIEPKSHHERVRLSTLPYPPHVVCALFIAAFSH